TAARECPVRPVATSDFLCDNGSFTFYNTPKELRGKADYYLSDDDRTFWWDGSGEVVLSEKMEQWLTELAQRHRQIMEEVKPENPEEFLRKFISVLAEADEFYIRIFCFQNMFYEFLQNSTDKRYIAAMLLFGKLVEEHKEEGKVIASVRDWSIESKNVTHNMGRITLKRYLGVIANRQLREKYFGF
ncbi:MAG: hypothetical protein NC489_47315, partial [Ruminococcus flavefaciens]|nr:hypothetical protein [Ruminococcus flavefaciens]